MQSLFATGHEIRPRVLFIDDAWGAPPRATLHSILPSLRNLLTDNEDLIAARCGRRIQINGISARDRHKDRGFWPGRFEWFEDATELAQSDRSDVLVELIGA